MKQNKTQKGKRIINGAKTIIGVALFSMGAFFIRNELNKQQVNNAEQIEEIEYDKINKIDKIANSIVSDFNKDIKNLDNEEIIKLANSFKEYSYYKLLLEEDEQLLNIYKIKLEDENSIDEIQNAEDTIKTYEEFENIEDKKEILAEEIADRGILFVPENLDKEKEAEFISHAYLTVNSMLPRVIGQYAKLKNQKVSELEMDGKQIYVVFDGISSQPNAINMVVIKNNEIVSTNPQNYPDIINESIANYGSWVYAVNKEKQAEKENESDERELGN